MEGEGRKCDKTKDYKEERNITKDDLMEQDVMEYGGIERCGMDLP